MADQMITLISKEGEEFTVEREFSKMCNLVKITLEDNEEDNRIPLDAIFGAEKMATAFLALFERKSICLFCLGNFQKQKETSLR